MKRNLPKKLTMHGHARIDNYYWLGERDNPEVIEYLRAENEYKERVMAHTEAFQETLFEGIRGRIKETDLSVPERKGDYFYYIRWEEVIPHRDDVELLRFQIHRDYLFGYRAYGVTIDASFKKKTQY